MPVRRYLLYQLIMYSCVRMKFEGFDDVPWYSPSNRIRAYGMQRIFNAS